MCVALVDPRNVESPLSPLGLEALPRRKPRHILLGQTQPALQFFHSLRVIVNGKFEVGSHCVISHFLRRVVDFHVLCAKPGGIEVTAMVFPPDSDIFASISVFNTNNWWFSSYKASIVVLVVDQAVRGETSRVTHWRTQPMLGISLFAPSCQVIFSRSLQWDKAAMRNGTRRIAAIFLNQGLSAWSKLLENCRRAVVCNEHRSKWRQWSCQCGFIC